MKAKSGRRGYEFEQSMESYRKWFTTGKQKTRFRNAKKLRDYCEWLGKSPEQLKREYIEARQKGVDALNDLKREIRNKIIEFYNYLKEQKGFAINYARCIPLGILAFYSQNCEKIPEVTKEFDPVQIPENEFVFSQEVLRKAYYYGDTWQKAMLSTAVSLGYASQDFLELECEKLSNLVKEAKDKHIDFIGFIGKTRQKTSVQPRSFLTPEAIDSLSEYLRQLESKFNGKLPKYLWCNHSENAHITNDNLNDRLKVLLKKANIETYGRQVKFHGLRKFLFDTLSKKDETIAKVITAKKTSASDVTYKTSLDSECERIFRECYKDIALNGDVTGKIKQQQAERIDSLEQAMKQLESENLALKTRIDGLQQTTKEQLDYIAQIDGRLQERDRELAKLGYRFDETTKELASIKKLISGLIPKESEEQAR